LETKNGRNRSNGKSSIPTAEEGYFNGEIQNGSSTHSQSHQAQNTSKNTDVQQRMAWASREIREVMRRYMYCTWESKVTHGQKISCMGIQLIGEEDKFLWLPRGDLKGETESEVTAVQDQALQTKRHVTKILKTETDSKCKLRQQFDERVAK